MAEPSTMTFRKPLRRKILAVASAGGHWIQLMRLRPAFEGLDVTYVTTESNYRTMVNGAPFRSVIDVNRSRKLQMVLLIFQLLWIMIRERPTVIVTTGSAPAYLAIRVGKWFGVKALWIDSIANAEELSMSGRLATRHADKVLTQWSHLAEEGGPEYRGAVI